MIINHSFIRAPLWHGDSSSTVAIVRIGHGLSFLDIDSSAPIELRPFA
jgi:hypothetical protein